MIQVFKPPYVLEKKNHCICWLTIPYRCGNQVIATKNKSSTGFYSNSWPSLNLKKPLSLLSAFIWSVLSTWPSWRVSLLFLCSPSGSCLFVSFFLGVCCLFVVFFVFFFFCHAVSHLHLVSIKDFIWRVRASGLFHSLRCVFRGFHGLWLNRLRLRSPESRTWSSRIGLFAGPFSCFETGYWV